MGTQFTHNVPDSNEPHPAKMSRLFIIALCFCLATLGDCRRRVKQSDGKIVGGVEISISKVPYLISLQNNNRHVCGGAILNAKFILTAAHCIVRFREQDLSVRVGSNYRNEGGEVYQVQRAIVHPQYNDDDSNNDIAVVELKRPISTSTGGKAILLANVEPRAGETALVAGWGAISHGGPSSKTLRALNVPVVSRAICSRLYARFNGVTSGMWCGGYLEGGKDSCQGDSGGPAVVNGRLAGVVSWGAGCAKKYSPGVYTNVVKYLDWIAKQTK